MRSLTATIYPSYISNAIYYRVELDVTDLEAHFAAGPENSEIEDLLRLANRISQRYLSATSAETVSTRPNLPGRHAFRNGSPWVPEANSTSTDQPALRGDHVFGNALTRMLDSMLHFEFHHAIAGGDIGRAMNVMAVCTISSILTAIY